MTALQAFEAALRHQSFTRAAEELHRTQGAISRQVSALEESLGVTLFRREHPRVRPTPVAEVFGAKLRVLLDRLEAMVLEAQSSRGQGGVLNLAILPTFGTVWLIPRIASFYEAHEGISINFTTRILPFDFESEELDAAIHHGEPVWPGARLEHLLDEDVVVVASPALLRRSKIEQPAVLVGRTLLQLDSRRAGWEEWFAATGVQGADGRRGPRFEHHLMVTQAAIAGLGVALLPSFLVRNELAAGSLVNPFGTLAVKATKAYWLAYPERSLELPALTALRDWLKERLAEEGLARPSGPSDASEEGASDPGRGGRGR